MNQPVLDPTDEAAEPTPVRRVRPPSALAGSLWAVGGAVAGGAAWAAVTVVFRQPEAAAAVWAAVAGGVGVLVGGAAGARGRAANGVVGAVGGGLLGAVSGGLGPLVARTVGPWLLPDVGFALGWALAGAAAGLVGYGWNRSRPADDEWGDGPGPLGRACAAAGWGLSAAVIAAGLWWAVLVAARAAEGGPPFSFGPVPESAVSTAGLAGACGLALGGGAGLAFGRRRLAAAGAGAVGVGLLGVLGGGLAPAMADATAFALPAEVGSSLAWALAGLVAGLVGYGWSRGGEPAEEPAEKAEEAVADESAPPPDGNPYRAAVLGVSVFAALVAFLGVVAAWKEPAAGGPLAVAALAITAAQGFAVAAALGRHERRITRLERRSGEWEERD